MATKPCKLRALFFLLYCEQQQLKSYHYFGIAGISNIKEVKLNVMF